MTQPPGPAVVPAAAPGPGWMDVSALVADAVMAMERAGTAGTVLAAVPAWATAPFIDMAMGSAMTAAVPWMGRGGWK